MRQLLSAAIVGFSALVGATAAGAQSDPATANCRESDPLPKQISCFLDAAKSADDAALCDDAYDFAVRFNCITLFAEHGGDAAACERIPIRNNRLLLMRDSCISGVAAALRAPGLCEQVQLYVVRDGCYLNQVVEFGAPAELCAKISRTDIREICLTPPENGR